MSPLNRKESAITTNRGARSCVYTHTTIMYHRQIPFLSHFPFETLRHLAHGIPRYTGVCRILVIDLRLPERNYHGKRVRERKKGSQGDMIFDLILILIRVDLA